MDSDIIDTGDDILKDCPLCGGEAELRYSGRLGRIVRCKKCHFGLKQKVLRYSTEWLEAKMIGDWNKRVNTSNN